VIVFGAAAIICSNVEPASLPWGFRCAYDVEE
jgi:hypothetical protein